MGKPEIPQLMIRRRRGCDRPAGCEKAYPAAAMDNWLEWCGVRPTAQRAAAAAAAAAAGRGKSAKL